ncbi:IIGP5 GTPase, partial [Atractosteus spatula]|nr:IIGP5 GTPase [Atractosteus spatula]
MMAEVLKNSKVLQTIKDSLDKNTMSDIKATLEDLLSNCLNIAVIGKRVPEKMTFINSLRGLGDDDVGSAHAGPADTNKEPIMYPHPQHSDVRIWDLSMPESNECNPNEYLETVKVNRYCSLIVTVSEHLAVACAALWKELHKAEKELYFILLTSVTDSSDSLLEKKRSSMESLRNQGVKSPQVFLVSSSALHQLEFMDLLEAMEKNIPELRMNALLFSLPSFSVPILKKKRAAFKAVVWTAASLSGGASTIPLPTVSSVLDVNMLMRILNKARDSFGLDDKSLERLAKQVRLPVAELESARTSELSIEISKLVIQRKLALAEKERSLGAKLVDTALTGSVKSMTKSFTTMYFMLTASLDELEEDAVRVLRKAYGDNH